MVKRKDTKEQLNYILCPHCDQKIYIENATKVIHIPTDRCSALSPSENLRCTLKKGHGGSHEHWPWNWG